VEGKELLLVDIEP